MNEHSTHSHPCEEGANAACKHEDSWATCVEAVAAAGGHAKGWLIARDISPSAQPSQRQEREGGEHGAGQITRFLRGAVVSV